MKYAALSWGHRRSASVFVHLLLPCSGTFRLQTAHAVELIRERQHSIGRQGVELLVTDKVLAYRLHNILLVVQQVIDLQREGSVLPCLVNGCVPDDLVGVIHARIAIAACEANIGADVPVFRQESDAS